MDIIYSRRKIKFKRPSKKEKLKLLFLALVFLILSSVVWFLNAAYPIFIGSCRTKANSMAINMVNEEVNRAVKNYKYND